MPDFFTANLDAARKTTRKVLEKLTEIRIPADWNVETGRRGLPTLSVTHPRGKTHLHSLVNPVVEAEKLVATVPYWSNGVVLVGMDLGYILPVLHKVLHRSKSIFVIVQNPAFLKLALQTQDLSEPLSSGRVIFAVNFGGMNMRPLVEEFCARNTYVHTLVHEPLLHIDPEKYSKLAAMAEECAAKADEDRPRVIMVAGLPGSGKTHLGQLLGDHLNYENTSGDRVARQVMEIAREPIFSITNLNAWQSLDQKIDLIKAQRYLYLNFARRVKYKKRAAIDGWMFLLKMFRAPLLIALSEINKLVPSYTLVRLSPPLGDLQRQHESHLEQFPDSGRIEPDQEILDVHEKLYEAPTPEERIDEIVLRGQQFVNEFVDRVRLWEGTVPLSVSRRKSEKWDAVRTRNYLLGKSFYQTTQVGDFRVVGDVDSISKVDLLNLPEDFAGDSLLDIGCNTGHFCFEAKKRGADRVVGIDNTRKYIVWARAVRDHVEMFHDVEFYNMDALEIEKLGRFDYVLLLAALHYMPDVRNIFKVVGNVCKKVFIMDLVMSPSLMEENTPLMEFRLDYKDFVPNMACIRELAAPYFTRLESVGGSVAPDNSRRFIFKAFK